MVPAKSWLSAFGQSFIFRSLFPMIGESQGEPLWTGKVQYNCIFDHLRQ